MRALIVIAIVALVGLGLSALLRLFGVDRRHSLIAGLVVLPLVVGVAAGLAYVSVVVITTLHLQVGGLVFGALATLVIASAGGVAMSTNILYSGFFLMGTLVGVAGLYLFIGADFLGIAQLVIYIGGILVLILFAVLLTNRISAIQLTNRAVQRGAGAGAAVLVALLLAMVALDTDWAVVEAVATPTTARLGDALLREYLLPFELISVVLLMALVGAMVIARRAAKDPPADPAEAPGLDRLE
ncbi:MAG: NADH-quinone oxidoreductase subunit J [Deltaproteobacteria bacterium]|nr:MAG: NADH-quinone oxidoreductase subunit J [Deltaproteobacteria bacterium]